MQTTIGSIPQCAQVHSAKPNPISDCEICAKVLNFRPGAATAKIDRRGRVRWLADGTNFVNLANNRPRPICDVLLSILLVHHLATVQILFRDRLVFGGSRTGKILLDLS
ncbi:MAG: hypothetical protein JO334_19590 [Verrucomicrobia bacterium]|nr:hypothetical protein [Verrucomicrobiota bacterium]